MAETITYQRLGGDLIPEDLLDSFNRYQQVTRSWRKENNQWVLKDNPYVEDWDLDKKRNVTRELSDCAGHGGVVFGAFCGGKLVGFATLASRFFGSSARTLEMPMIEVSFEYRHHGIGRQLFALIADSAKRLGAAKLYISAHSSEESQAFYKAVGCTQAQEVNREIAENEPYDCQLEYVL